MSSRGPTATARPVRPSQRDRCGGPRVSHYRDTGLRDQRAGVGRGRRGRSDAAARRIRKADFRHACRLLRELGTQCRRKGLGIDLRGCRTTCGYDAVDRVISRKSPGTGRVAFADDTNGRRTQLARLRQSPIPPGSGWRLAMTATVAGRSDARPTAFGPRRSTTPPISTSDRRHRLELPRRRGRPAHPFR